MRSCAERPHVTNLRGTTREQAVGKEDKPACSPCVLITCRSCPFDTRSARPLHAGTVKTSTLGTAEPRAKTPIALAAAPVQQ